MAITPRRSIKDDLEELRAMRRRSEERQGRKPIEDAGNTAGPKAMQAKGTERKFASMKPAPEFKTKTRLDGSKYQAKVTNQTETAYKSERLMPNGDNVGGVKSVKKAVEDQKKKKRGQTRNQLYGT